jgi:putative hydrolase
MISPWITAMQSTARGNVVPYDFHMHTTWTDGKNSAVEMHQRAVEAGLKVILFSEHARKSSGDWFKEFAAEVRALPKDKCTALVGVEAKVDDFDGNIDTNAMILGEVDLVMASVHRFPGETGDVKGTKGFTAEQAIDHEFRLSMAVLDNQDVDVLGHPFGMCHRRFKTEVPDHLFKEIINKAARTQVAIEINPHYHPAPWKILQWCQEAGALISLGSNAHNVDEVGRVKRVLEGKEAPWQM